MPPPAPAQTLWAACSRAWREWQPASAELCRGACMPWPPVGARLAGNACAVARADPPLPALLQALAPLLPGWPTALGGVAGGCAAGCRGMGAAAAGLSPPHPWWPAQPAKLAFVSFCRFCCASDSSVSFAFPGPFHLALVTPWSMPRCHKPSNLVSISCCCSADRRERMRQCRSDLAALMWYCQ